MRSHPSCWNKTLVKLGFRRKLNKKQIINSDRRRFSFEPLEQRQMLSVTVDTLVDDNDSWQSGYATNPNGVSLREALVKVANTSETEINFAPDLIGAIHLEHGHLSLTSNVTILGPGHELLTVDAQGDSRVFAVGAGVNATIEGLTITGGDAQGGGGGGIANYGGNLTLQSVEVTDNQALGNLGGGVFNTNSSSLLTVLQTTFSNNRARSGGAISSPSPGGLTVGLSTFVGNQAINTTAGSNDATGGAIHLYGQSSGATAFVTTSTFSGNSSEYRAGAIQMGGNSAINLWNSTVAFNNAETSDGGIRIESTAVPALLHNTILAENTNSGTIADDGSGSLDSASLYNIVQAHSGSSSLTGAGNQIGVDPKLDPTLRDHGGPTHTHALQIDSPAIDAGTNGFAGTTDQRGYRRKVDADNDGSSLTLDIGAYEYGLVVTTLTDEDTTDYDRNHLSLREAIDWADSLPGADIIEFELGLTGTISLAHGTLPSPTGDSLTVQGPGVNALTVDAGGTSRFFYAGSSSDLTLNDLTLTGGDSGVGSGGGIVNYGDLTLNSVAITDSHAVSSLGGAIYSVGTSTLTINESTFSDNSANKGGGVAFRSTAADGLSISGSAFLDNDALESSTGTGGTGGGLHLSLDHEATIVNTTFSGNEAIEYTAGSPVAVNAGAIHVDTNGTSTATLTITNSTIANNDSDGSVGGLVKNGSATVTLHNTILADNIGTGATPDGSGTIDASSSNNLVENASVGTLNGTNIAGQDPKLLALGNYGGPTLTQGLRHDSPAIDEGSNANAVSVDGTPLFVDQRGKSRIIDKINGVNDGTPTVDIGASEWNLTADVIRTVKSGVWQITVDNTVASMKEIILSSNRIGEVSYLTVNGDVTEYDENDFDLLRILGSDESELIDISGVNEVDFPVFAPAGSILKIGSFNPDAPSEFYFEPPRGQILVRAGGGDDKIIGSELSDILFGEAGNDLIDGSGGDDTLGAGSGENQLDGGAGNDRFDLTNIASSRTIIIDSDGNETISLYDWHESEGTTRSGAELDLSRQDFQTLFSSGSTTVELEIPPGNDIEDIIGSPFDDLLRGNDLTNRINGSYGDDELYGGDGIDWLDGSYGRDSVFGEAGFDHATGGYGDFDLNEGAHETFTDSLDASLTIIDPLTVSNELRWIDRTVGEDGFEIQVSPNGIDEWRTWKFAHPSMFAGRLVAVQYDETITSETRAYFRVRALRFASGHSDWSAVERTKTIANEDRVVQASVDISESLSSGNITLSWPGLYDQQVDTGSGLSNFEVFRRSAPTDSWLSVASGITGTQWSDPNSSVGESWEYRVKRTGGDISIEGNGYVYAGLEFESPELLDGQGTVLLVLDDSIADDLAIEIARLKQDLSGDGWDVVTLDVAPGDDSIQAVRSLKNRILAEYNKPGASVKSVYLLGDIPVPRSTEYRPDGHARPYMSADAYYGDLNEASWTDTDGDGLFEQTTIPADSDSERVELMVGRVDMSDLPAFAAADPNNTEVYLLKRYLDKDHAFRHGLIDVRERGLIQDDFREGIQSESSSFSNFSSFFGHDEVHRRRWFGTLEDPDESYLWAYAGQFGRDRAGLLTGSDAGVADYFDTESFANRPSYAVFTQLFGSYLVDYDWQNNLLRSVLANEGYGLTASWGQRPEQFYHHMGLGETVGFGNLITQNNSVSGNGYLINGSISYANDVHIALMGDPTLRMHVVQPPSNVTAEDVGNDVEIEWMASADTGVTDYHVYRADFGSQNFTRLTTSSPVSSTIFTDPAPGLVASDYTYMVRAVKLQESGSGSYYNLSQGAFSLLGGYNAGDGTVGDFAEDNSFVTGNSNYTPGSAPQVDMSHPSVPLGTPEEIFHTAALQSVAGVSMQWTFGASEGIVAGGEYAVQLYFAEIDSTVTAAGDRVFDIQVESETLNDFDIFAEVGANTAIVKIFNVTVGVDGELNISLDAATSSKLALVSAIEIFEV